MRENRSTQPLALLRRLARPSSVARAVWLIVAVLHAWLVLRRVALGEWTGLLDMARGVLCLAGVAYASLKFWQVATIFDSAPRRVLAFVLILTLGHWLIAPPSQPGDLFPSPAAVQVTAILVLAPALGVTLRWAWRLLRAARPPARLRVVTQIRISPLAHLPLAIARRLFFLFHRPPPPLAA